MKDFTIKVTFDTTAEDSSVRFDTFEEVIVKLIRERKNDSITVFVQNPMPLSEFKTIISEVCERIRFNTEPSVSFIPYRYNLNEDNYANMASYCIHVTTIE